MNDDLLNLCPLGAEEVRRDGATRLGAVRAGNAVDVLPSAGDVPEAQARAGRREREADEVAGGTLPASEPRCAGKARNAKPSEWPFGRHLVAEECKDCRRRTSPPFKGERQYWIGVMAGDVCDRRIAP